MRDWTGDQAHQYTGESGVACRRCCWALQGDRSRGATQLVSRGDQCLVHQVRKL